MKGWMVAVCCAGLLLCGCGAEEVQAPQSAVPQTEAVRVACVGDSITQGFGGHSYVAVLAEADGEAVYGNFGVCGTTALASGAPSYADTQAYAESLAWGADVVVLMLGTNDTAYWQGAATFGTDLGQLADAYLDTGAQVLLCTPLALDVSMAANDYGVNPAYFADVCDAVHRVAAARDLPVAEVYAETEGQPFTLADGIHPNQAGAEALAAVIGSALKELMA